MGVLEATAETLGASDVFALHRVAEGQLVNLDGVGRGNGWAGNIVLESGSEPWLEAGGGGPTRHVGEVARLFGPFWSSEAAQVPVGAFVIVFSGPGVCRHDDDTLVEAAAAVAWSVGEVPTEKRLADELEIAQAGLAIASIEGDDPETVARRLATEAAELLGCEFAAVLLAGDPDHVVYGDGTWRPDASEAEVAEAIHDLVGSTSKLVFDHEVATSPEASRPLAHDDGLVARCAIPLRAGAHDLGWLCCAHTIDQPRGFTSLCQRVAETIGDQGARVLERAAA